MAPPDARPDVTARIAAADKLIERSGWSINEDDDIDDARALLADLARRLTEQEAEIARLRERLTTLENERAQRVSALANGVPKKALAFIAENPKTARDHELSTLLDLLTAAEQALTAARRERDTLVEERLREVWGAICARVNGGFTPNPAPTQGMVLWIVGTVNDAFREALKSVAAPGPAATEATGGRCPVHPDRGPLCDICGVPAGPAAPAGEDR